ncbi:TonB-dependent receptor plug domain-containing protein [Ferruginibacter lapsinanis]|uniref:TonB-dependent receptor plug domain-containing protein n=1 Tax=Ferruginibacter lapsinanis TaxID=563172 RepID=UPI001E358CA9|nr:TonB-dependent receptor plug domain-containing protein [Ferruginibacter lapsinanis]UEG49754.1 TonB-dependent receptor plug domain-containing protein [Ferruginibacter lapsinanis]
MDAIQIKIAEPCHENWQNMTATDKGRYCGACKKEVIDFTSMSDAELINYLSSLKNKNICGSALPQQLDRPIYRLKEPRKPLAWYWNYIMLLLLFFSRSTAKAQVVKGKVMAVPPKELVSVKPSCDVLKNTDTARDKMPEIPIQPNHNDPLSKPEESVDEKQQMRVGGMSVSIVSESSPMYIVDGVVIENLSGVDPKEIESIDVLKDATNAAIYGRMSSNEVVIITTKRRSVKEAAKKIIATIADSLKITPSVSTLKVFPNPVVRGDIFSIEGMVVLGENYLLQVTDVSGNIVFQRSIRSATKRYREQLKAVDKWSSGGYFIQLIDATNKLVSTGRFIVE